jgi:hypothetical protein
MAIATNTTFTRRAITRLLALSPIAVVPVAVAAAPRTLDEDIAELTAQLSEKIRQRWPDATVQRFPYCEEGCAYLLTAFRA